MKRSKKLVVLLGVLGAACAATFGVTKYEEEKEQIKNSDEIILELAGDQVTALSWEYGTEYLAFHKDEAWLYDEDEAFPVNEEKLMDMLKMFESFGVSFIIEEVEDFAQYGLDDPMCTITLTTAEQTYTLQLGDFSTMDSERYVSLGDGNVYLVKEDPFETFEVTISDMIDHDELPDFDQVNEIRFSGAEESQIVYEEDSTDTYCEEDVYFVKKEEENLPLDTAAVKQYLRTITNLGLEDYVTYNATEEELETYGMVEPELSVTVQHSWEDGETEQVMEETFVLHVSRDPEEIVEAEKAAETADAEGVAADDEDDEKITAYARVGESQIVYQLASGQYEKLMAASYHDLRHQEVLSASFADINQIDISLEGADYTIMTDGEADERVYLYGEEKLEIAEFKDALEALTADSFTDEEPAEKEEISLVAHLDHENFPEVHIELYRYDGSFCLAVVDGEPVSLIERDQVVDLIEAVNSIVLG